MRRVGVAAVARPTFDVDFATATATAAFSRLRETGWDLLGGPELHMDLAAVSGAVDDLRNADLDGFVLLQASFTDSTVVTPFAALSAPSVVLWAFPEDRTGGRLRLNSLCGINLAGFALREADAPYNYLYRAPNDPEALDELRRAMSAEAVAQPPVAIDEAEIADATLRRARRVVEKLRAATIGVIGDHPTGFEPCAYDAGRLRALAGASVDRIELSEIFERASAVSADQAAPVRALVGHRLSGADAVDQLELDRSVRLHVALDNTAAERGWSGLAMRCWPECFTDYGSAACAAQAMLSDQGLVGCCEADVYGGLTALVLQWLGGGPAFVADLVELDPATETGVMWHCGIAAYALADPEAKARAAVHSNRAKPLLHEFPLKPGRVTLARLSQAGGTDALVVGGGEVLRAPVSFSGTSGVVRFDARVDDVLATVMGHGLEHHYGLVYGDVREELRAVATLLRIPVVELTPTESEEA